MARSRRKRRFSRVITKDWWPELEATFAAPEAWARPKFVRIHRGVTQSTVSAQFQGPNGARIKGVIRILWPAGKPGQIREIVFTHPTLESLIARGG